MENLNNKKYYVVLHIKEGCNFSYLKKANLYIQATLNDRELISKIVTSKARPVFNYKFTWSFSAEVLQSLINNCINIFVQVFAINDLNQRWKVGHTEVGIECIQHKIKNKPLKYCQQHLYGTKQTVKVEQPELCIALSVHEHRQAYFANENQDDKVETSSGTLTDFTLPANGKYTVLGCAIDLVLENVKWYTTLLDTNVIVKFANSYGKVKATVKTPVSIYLRQLVSQTAVCRMYYDCDMDRLIDILLLHPPVIYIYNLKHELILFGCLNTGKLTMMPKFRRFRAFAYIKTPTLDVLGKLIFHLNIKRTISHSVSKTKNHEEPSINSTGESEYDQLKELQDIQINLNFINEKLSDNTSFVSKSLSYEKEPSLPKQEKCKQKKKNTEKKESPLGGLILMSPKELEAHIKKEMGYNLPDTVFNNFLDLSITESNNELKASRRLKTFSANFGNDLYNLKVRRDKGVKANEEEITRALHCYNLNDPHVSSIGMKPPNISSNVCKHEVDAVKDDWDAPQIKRIISNKINYCNDPVLPNQVPKPPITTKKEIPEKKLSSFEIWDKRYKSPRFTPVPLPCKPISSIATLTDKLFHRKKNEPSVTNKVDSNLPTTSKPDDQTNTTCNNSLSDKPKVNCGTIPKATFKSTNESKPAIKNEPRRMEYIPTPAVTVIKRPCKGCRTYIEVSYGKNAWHNDELEFWCKDCKIRDLQKKLDITIQQSNTNINQLKKQVNQLETNWTVKAGETVSRDQYHQLYLDQLSLITEYHETQQRNMLLEHKYSKMKEQLKQLRHPSTASLTQEITSRAQELKEEIGNYRNITVTNENTSHRIINVKQRDPEVKCSPIKFLP